jgi:hypothetical protein
MSLCVSSVGLLAAAQVGAGAAVVFPTKTVTTKKILM